MAKPQLSPEVAEKYKLVTLDPGIHQIKGYGIVDLTKLTLEHAETLVAAGFPYLVAKKRVEAAKP